MTSTQLNLWLSLLSAQVGLPHGPGRRGSGDSGLGPGELVKVV